MPHKDPEVRRARDRERVARRTAERMAAGLCPTCGRRRTEPGHRNCAPCAAKARAAGWARAARLRDLQHSQDGSEINARELELTTDRARNLGDRRGAFEDMLDTAADGYRAATGDTWRGSHTSRTGKLTSAAIDARDFLRAR